MPYDPAKPADHSDLSSPEMRGQLNGLKALIDAGTITDVVVDAVNTVAPGTPANVTASLTGGVLHLAFDIPQGVQGAEGAQGQPGMNGSDGQQGPVGPQGDVSAGQLAAVEAGSSANTNAVPTLDAPFTNDPPTLADMETLRAKANELIVALRRP
jgi:hypothetical protein